MCEIEIQVDKVFMECIEYDKLNSFYLRSDIENDLIQGLILRSQGYVGNRPSECEDEYHEDDTWAIDSFDGDGICHTSYLYVSEFEYNQDLEILKKTL